MNVPLCRTVRMNMRRSGQPIVDESSAVVSESLTTTGTSVAAEPARTGRVIRSPTGTSVTTEPGGVR